MISPRRADFIIEKRGNAWRESRVEKSDKLVPPGKRFPMNELVNKECLKPEYKPDKNGKCQTGQKEICVKDGENWKMLLCKLDGVINPQTGKCHCDESGKKKVFQNHRRTTRNLKKSHRRQIRSAC